MEEKKEYLNEEEFQKKNQKVKKIGKILLIVGGIIALIGIIMTFTGFINYGKSATSGINSMFNTASNTFSNFDEDSDASDLFKGFSDITSSTTNSYKNATNYIALFIMGSFMNVIGFGLMIAGGVMLIISNRREISAYVTQQTMPIKQEKLEKITPTVADSASEIAKEVNESIKEEDNK